MIVLCIMLGNVCMEIYSVQYNKQYFCIRTTARGWRCLCYICVMEKPVGVVHVLS